MPRPEWHLLRNPATEAHGTVSGKTVYFSVSCRGQWYFRFPWNRWSEHHSLLL